MSEFFTTDPATRALIQENLLQKLFQDSLFPQLLYRKEFTAEQWMDRAQQVIKSRAGLMAVNLASLPPKTDPIPANYDIEKWDATIVHKGNTVDTDIVVSQLTLADLLERDVRTVGLNAGQSVNRLARDAAFNAAGYGHTVTTTVGVGAAKVVPYINGFTRAYNVNTRLFDPVSVTNPLPIYIRNGGAWVAASVIGVTPVIAGDEYGPGTLTLLAPAVTALRDPIVATTASWMVRSGGGFSVDALVAADTLTLADLRSAVARFRTMNVMPYPDGYYHCHLDPTAEAEIYGDGEFQLLFRGRGLDRDENDPYAMFEIGTLLGIKLYRNNESPVPTNVPAVYGATTGNWAQETTNAAGVPVHRTVLFGLDHGVEYWKDVAQSTEAGITGKIGNWNITTSGLSVDVDRIQMILRAPIDRMQRVVSTSWSFFGSHVAAQDYLFPGRPFDAFAATQQCRYKRIIQIEHA